jgi:hypothetical protein
MGRAGGTPTATTGRQLYSRPSPAAVELSQSQSQGQGQRRSRNSQVGQLAAPVAGAISEGTPPVAMRTAAAGPCSEQFARGKADEALAAGTRLRVSPHGEGVYERFERSTFGANDHYIRFDSGGTKKVALKNLQPQDWAVLAVPVEQRQAVSDSAGGGAVPVGSPCFFDSASEGVELKGGVVTSTSVAHLYAVSAPLASNRVQYVELTGAVQIGLVLPSFDAASYRAKESKPHRTGEGWMLHLKQTMKQTDNSVVIGHDSEGGTVEPQFHVYTLGKPSHQALTRSNRFGLEFNPMRGTLALYADGQRLGLLVYPGISSTAWRHASKPAAAPLKTLVGQEGLRWAVELGSWASASIADFMPDAGTPTEDVLIEEERQAIVLQEVGAAPVCTCPHGYCKACKEWN